MSKKLTEVEKLKYWIDAEITLLHIGFYVLVGLIVGGKVWWFCGGAIFISLVYAAKKSSKLPRDYLK